MFDNLATNIKRTAEGFENPFTTDVAKGVTQLSLNNIY